MVRQNISFRQQHMYHLSHQPSGEENSLWLVFHGYGQLGNFFLKKFSALFDPKTLMVAPEGLNRFYLKGFSGRVGANWMTKHERENDMANANSYLNALIKNLRQQLPQLEHSHVLGFSQGAATMSRWICQAELDLDKVVFWGGAPAHDLDPELLQKTLANSRVIAALGEEDPFLATANFQAQLKQLTSAGLSQLQIKYYPGGHELEAGLLKEIFLM
ncbi:dienelactone hydrolase family protein [Cyclobacterium sp.]|uniref:alpha/beta hydrolase n=1 Tax=Cyclobacterium sp. TaxID=1966343 RepID=UPI0019A473BC|nr:dienelactone hydrolase family protein [Cyclobacterium sp.]MBD3629509.1 dienelactone hydrolase family protein [Cyclobacterium sp.]